MCTLLPAMVLNPVEGSGEGWKVFERLYGRLHGWLYGPKAESYVYTPYDEQRWYVRNPHGDLYVPNAVTGFCVFEREQDAINFAEEYTTCSAEIRRVRWEGLVGRVRSWCENDDPCTLIVDRLFIL